MLAEGRSHSEVIEQLYRTAVCRPPTEVELKSAIEYIGNKPDAAAGLEDVCWVLLNTDEFLTQH
jgi:hypothetical protein